MFKKKTNKGTGKHKIEMTWLNNKSNEYFTDWYSVEEEAIRWQRPNGKIRATLGCFKVLKVDGNVIVDRRIAYDSGKKSFFKKWLTN